MTATLKEYGGPKRREEQGERLQLGVVTSSPERDYSPSLSVFHNCPNPSADACVSRIQVKMNR